MYCRTVEAKRLLEERRCTGIGHVEEVHKIGAARARPELAHDDFGVRHRMRATDIQDGTLPSGSEQFLGGEVERAGHVATAAGGSDHVAIGLR